jgi:hypothetical protein
MRFRAAIRFISDFISAIASAPRARSTPYGSHQESADRYASPFPRTQYTYTSYSVGPYPVASPSDVSSGQTSAWEQYAPPTASMPGPSPVIPAYPPGYEAYFPAPLTPYSTSYTYGTGDPSGSYYYGPTPAYEPRNSSSTATFTNAMLSSPEHVAPSGSRSVTSVARSAARSHAAHTTHHSSAYNPYSRAARPTAGSSSATESVGGTHDYPSNIKKKRKRANADQLSVLNEVRRILLSINYCLTRMSGLRP